LKPLDGVVSAPRSRGKRSALEGDLEQTSLTTQSRWGHHHTSSARGYGSAIASIDCRPAPGIRRATNGPGVEKSHPSVQSALRRGTQRAASWLKARNGSLMYGLAPGQLDRIRYWLPEQDGGQCGGDVCGECG